MRGYMITKWPWILQRTWIPGQAGVHGNEVAIVLCRIYEMTDYFAKSGSKSKMHGPEPFITVPHASCVSMVKD